MKNSNNYLIILIGLIFTFIFSLKVKAEEYNFNFEYDLQGNYLDPFALDTYGKTTEKPIGEMWKSRGIMITTKNTDKQVGLFQSSCIPDNGLSLTAKEILCRQKNYGNNGLATGEGRYFTKNNEISYKTEPQGNILIIEGNPGNGIPEDYSNGGTIRFDFDRTLLSRVIVNQIGIVDNAQGNILVKYMDGEEYVQKINHKYRNQLEFYDIPKKDVEYIEVTFKGNGGITGITFDELIALTIPNGNSSSFFSSFATPSIIAGSLGTFGIISGSGNQSKNDYTEVFEPYFAKNNENQLLSPKNEDPSFLQPLKEKHKEDTSVFTMQNIDSDSTSDSPLSNIDGDETLESVSVNNSPEAVAVPEPSIFMGTIIALAFGKIMQKRRSPNVLKNTKLICIDEVRGKIKKLFHF